MTMMRDAMLRDGYVVVPGLFTVGQIVAWRRAIDAHFDDHGNIFKLGKTQPNAAMTVPGIEAIFYDPKVIAAFRAAMGSDNIVFTGHCDVHKGMFSGWHKDTGPDNGYFVDDCFAGECGVYKMGVYLQDHHEGGGAGEGLTVVPGSHRDRNIVERGATTLGTRAGDAVIFDVRITHRGKTSDRIDKLLYRANQAIKIAAARIGGRQLRKDDLAIAYRLRRAWDMLTGRRNRHSIFFTFGAPGAMTDQFARANLDRQLVQNRAGGRLPENLTRGLQDGGIALAPALAVFSGPPAR